jgi:hypothetical protein
VNEDLTLNLVLHARFDAPVEPRDLAVQLRLPASVLFVHGVEPGTFEAPLTDGRGASTPFTLSCEVSVPTGGRVHVSAITIRSDAADRPVTAETLHQVAGSFDSWMPTIGAGFLAQQAAASDGYFKFGADGGLILEYSSGAVTATLPSGDVLRGHGELRFDVPEDALRIVVRELSRRQRSRLTDADYQRVADAYRRGERDGVPVKGAVAAEMCVTESRAAQLISESRKRGLLGPRRSGNPGKRRSTEGES